jgi:hypothetical protein
VSTTSVMCHMNTDPLASVKCRWANGGEKRFDDCDYPVLQVGGGVTIFPSVDQVRMIHAVVGKFLESVEAPKVEAAL